MQSRAHPRTYYMYVRSFAMSLRSLIVLIKNRLASTLLLLDTSRRTVYSTSEAANSANFRPEMNMPRDELDKRYMGSLVVSCISWAANVFGIRLTTFSRLRVMLPAEIPREARLPQDSVATYIIIATQFLLCLPLISLSSMALGHMYTRKNIHAAAGSATYMTLSI